MLTSTKNTIILCMILLSCVVFSTLAVGQDKAGWLNDTVTVRFQEEPMSAVLGKISQQTGIAILYDEKLADQKVTGHYKDIKFSEAINRLFSDKNKSIQVFKNEKKIIVKTFGAKQFILAGDTPMSTKEHLHVDNLSLDEIRTLQVSQYNEFRNQISDENEIIAKDMTRSQLKAFIKNQNKQFKDSLKNENEVVTKNKTRAQLRMFVSKQNKAFENSLLNDEEQIGENGETRLQLREFIQDQDLKFNNTLTEGEQLVVDGKTRNELKQFIQAEQSKMSSTDN
ncbi:MAG: hypothetical protein WGN25_09740 [Candidatus Electrothrix sp. GW3-4]|uniref:hypothetical protein n=1 Tax=Candidatus Electrothrix sp. GW3-4 TaxID=3126740 RepID=UPI0030CDBA3F